MGQWQSAENQGIQTKQSTLYNIRPPVCDLQITALTNNGVLMRNVVQLFLAANTIPLMCKWNHACKLLIYVISVITPGRQPTLSAFQR